MVSFRFLGVVFVVGVVGTNAEPWYKTGPMYQIYPSSFSDADGDGVGDLRGIIKHADYLKGLGIGIVWLSPVFESPMKDNGYDVSNYTAINSIFGNMADMESLIDAFHKRGIKVMLDFIPNHTSQDHIWFVDSVKKRNGKEDWYVWKDPKGKDKQGNPIPPNNWRSNFGVGLSAWTYNSERGQFYYHQFGDYQPDLNYENSEVLTAIKEIIRFWLRKGIDGFRMDAVTFIGETNYGSDEPTNCHPDDGTYACLSHIYTMNQDLTFRVLSAFDEVAREPEFTKTGARALYLEAYNPLEEQLKYYGNVSFPFNFQTILNIKKNSDAYAFQNITMGFLNSLKGQWPNWVTGNHDNPRVGSRMGSAMIDTMNILTLLLPGMAITYYGEELGMTDGIIKQTQRHDFGLSRDPERTPMQWDTSKNAGFSNSSKLYLPVNSNYYAINVATESSSQNSHLAVYKKAVKLHNELIATSLEPLTFKALRQWVFGFSRPGVVVVTNINNKEEIVTIRDFNFTIPPVLTVALAPSNTNMSEGAEVSADHSIVFFPKSTLVFKYGTTSMAAALHFSLFFTFIGFLLCVFIH